MARKGTSICVEQLTDGKWKHRINGFENIPEAKQWVDENIKEGERLRVIRVSGVFELEKKTIRV